MQTTLFHGSGRLLGTNRGELSPWAMLVEDGLVAWAGPAADAPDGESERIDLGSALVTPGLVDAHTHPVFAGDRSDEMAARLSGAPYTGGGILRTVASTRAASDAELERLVDARLRAALSAGTTTVECKSGYGLSADEELRHLRIIGRVAARLPLRVVRTLLGAHAVPPEAASAAEHAARVADEMIPAVAAEGLATFVDVFADAGFFDLAATERIAAAARSAGLGVRLHAEQLARTGAAELGVRVGAASVDHLERLDEDGIRALAGGATVATLLPAPALLMGLGLPPARALLDAGVSVALASDANAGTFEAFGAMPLVIGLGAAALRMTVGEAVRAATAGGARALRLEHAVGALVPGHAADFAAWDAEHEGAFALRLGGVRATRVFVAGREVAR